MEEMKDCGSQKRYHNSKCSAFAVARSVDKPDDGKPKFSTPRQNIAEECGGLLVYSAPRH